jgi:heme exporter protein C
MLKRAILGLLVFALVGASTYASFFIAPDERTMGLIYRIFYFHAACGWVMFTAFFTCFFSNIAYVLGREPRWDALGVSSAEVGVAFNTVVLITGPIWAHPVWGIWWTWDARLTSTFVLWLLYIAYLVLRSLIEEPDRRALLSSVFGIFAFLDVPLVYGSIRWWRTQHPQPVIMGSPGSGLAPMMLKVFFFSVFAMHALMLLLLAERYRLEKVRGEVDVIRRELEAA